jgi:endonuclease I
MKKLSLLALSLVFLACSTEESPNNQPEPNPEPTTSKPEAVNDSYLTKEDEEAQLSGYLNNDKLENNAKLSAFDHESVMGAEVVDNRNGSFTYIPVADFTGEDSFTYTICDSNDECSTATITVNVEDSGSPQANEDEANTVVGQSVNIDNLFENDEMLDEAQITGVDSSNTQGSVELQADGTVYYIPPTAYAGTDTFTYTICDDDAEATCSTATVTVNIYAPLSFNLPAGVADYYSDLKLTASTDLNFEFVEDHTAVKHSTILEYYQRHDFLYDADEDPDNTENVILMYSGESRYWEEYQSPNNNYNPQTFNTEHVYPKSKLNTEESKNDLHLLRVADADVNEERWNYPFNEGSGNYELLQGNEWYPGDEWKGDVARIIMYVNIRYGDSFSDVGNLDLFLKWNIEDPVSEFEMQRNDVIETAQGNRNPFIDNPYLATLIWGGADAENRWE